MTDPKPPSPVPAADGEWMPFPGGELLGERSQVSCAACRSRRDSRADTHGRTLCFQCYRATLERRRRLAAALEAVVASDQRFQETRPFEPVDRERLDRLRAARLAERQEATLLNGFARRRRAAQIAARHVLESGDCGMRAGQHKSSAADRETRVVHAVAVGAGTPLSMPLAWLPFLMSR
jgi:hypothetical protein